MLEEYIRHWWAGDVGQYYELFNLNLGQVNKLAKIGQYLTGVLALFDLISFSIVMGHLRIASYVAIWSYRFWNRLLNIPILLVRLLLAAGSALVRRLPWSQVPKVFQKHVADAVDQSSADAESFPLVSALRWLELHPIPDKAIKSVNFCLFLLFSGVELFMS